MADNEHNSTEKLLTLLVKKGALQADALQQEREILVQQREAGEKTLRGTRIVLDQSQQTLTFFDYPDDTEKARVDLPFDKQVFNPELWLQSGRDFILLQQDTHKKSEDISFLPLESPALARRQEMLLSPLGPFLKTEQWTQHNLPLSSHWQWSIKPRQDVSSGPLDLHLSPTQDLLAVVNRHQGTLALVDLKTFSLRTTMVLRKPGSDRGLHVHFDPGQEQLLVTDNTSSIGRWQYDGTVLERLSPGAGLLGNSVYLPEDQLLFAISTRPSVGLKVIRTDTGTLEKEIALKGDLFSVRSDAPFDLMSLHPEGGSLALMTYLNEPEPFTPVVSVIDTQRQKTTQRYALKDGTRPTALCFEALNPLASKNQNLIQVLQSKNLISGEDLHNARIDLREQEQAEAASAQSPAQLLDMDQRAYEESQEQAEEAEQEASEANPDAPAFKPEKAPQMNISPVADELIVNYCIQDIKAKTLGQIRLDDEEAEEKYANHLERLKAAAMRARNELEWHNGAVIKLRDFLDGKVYEAVIMREEMETLLHKHERDSLVTAGMPTVPSNCPNCSKPLFGSYVCSYCGYEIERPEEMLKKGLISIATLTPMENLVPGHFLLIDIEGKRILEIDTERNITWTVGKDLLSEGSIELNFPRDAVRMTNRNTLITDMVAGRVLEMTPSGRLFWEYKGKGEEKQLKSPVRATANGLGNVLIVDQGRHRVIEVSHQSEILHQFGITDQYGIAEDYLNMPSDAQMLVNGSILITDTGNHRVIEIEDRKIVWQYGNPENLESGAYGADDGLLSYPQAALRLPNGNTLIVDAGNLRLIEIDPQGKLLWQHRTDQGEEEFQMDSPFRAAYVPNENLVMLLSENAVIEIRPTPDKADKANAESRAQAQEVVWGCRLSRFERAKVQLKSTQPTRQFIARHGVKNPYLRTTTKEGEASEAAQQRLQEMIQQRLAKSRQSNENKAHITRFDKEDPLPALDFFLLERSHNRVVRTDREGDLSWRYGESEDQHLNKPHACTRTETGNVMIADTDNHRILEVNPENNEVVWQFGEKNQPEKAERGLDRPRFAQLLPNQRVLIVDQNNRRVFEMKKNRQIMWQYEGMEHLMVPYHAERLANGNTLITDWGAHWVLEVSPDKEVVWSFGQRKTSGNDHSHLSYPEHATRLSNGNTLISDTRNHRVIEVNPDKEVVWELDGQDRVKYGTPTYAQRMDNGNTLILHSSNRQMLEVTPKSKLMWKLMLPFSRSPAKAPSDD
jgi:uncharacterized protein (UPF0248 family)